MNTAPRTLAVIACTLLTGATLLMGAVGPGMATAPAVHATMQA